MCRQTPSRVREKVVEVDVPISQCPGMVSYPWVIVRYDCQSGCEVLLNLGACLVDERIDVGHQVQPVGRSGDELRDFIGCQSPYELDSASQKLALSRSISTSGRRYLETPGGKVDQRRSDTNSSRDGTDVHDVDVFVDAVASTKESRANADFSEDARCWSNEMKLLANEGFGEDSSGWTGGEKRFGQILDSRKRTSAATRVLMDLRGLASQGT